MFDTHTTNPLSSALADGTAARVGNRLPSWQAGMGHRTASFTIRRGVLR